MPNKDRFDNRGRPIQRAIPEWVFGETTLFSQGLGTANWARAERTSALPTDQKSTTGWLAKLYGGTQSDYGDGAALYISMNEMPLTKLSSAQWTYWMEAQEVYGCQVQIWVHDPTDNTKRGDIIQSGTAASLAHASGWNGHILNKNTGVQFFYYAENEGSPGLTEGPGNLYSLADFQADTVFKTWTIYRISLNNGFYNVGHFGDMYVADVKINGEVIPLKPTVAELIATKNRVVATTSKTLLAATVYDATDVMSEATSNATDWDFEFGITGRITQAIVTSATTGMNDALVLHLYSAPPSCELDDHATNTSPVVGDLDDFIGAITFPILSSAGGASFAVALNNASGVGLPLTFNTTTIYGVIYDVGGGDDFANGQLTISLTAEI